MKLRDLACLVGLFFLFATAAFAGTIQLTVERGPGVGQVTLNWSGGAGPYDVYASTLANGLVDPLNLIATVPDPTFVDTPPDVPLVFYDVEQVAGAVCGNGIREAGEQCDDGNLVRLDGCGPDCQFEQVQRMNWLKWQFATDTFCTSNRLGSAVTSIAQSQFQTQIDQGVLDGSFTILLTALGITDLSGTSEASFPLGFVGGTPAPPGATPYNGTSDLEWWYDIDPTSVDASRQPLSSLPAAIAAHVLTAGPGVVQAPLLPGSGPLRMSSTRVTVTTGSSSTPLVSTDGDPPGHLPSENLDPALTSYSTCGVPNATGSGKLCGDVVANGLAQVPIDPSLPTTCIEGYTLANSMLDVFVGGCKGLGGLVTVINPVQPDHSDPTAPVAGAGPPYKLVENAQHAVTTCRDVNNAVVDLNTCLNSAAYSSFFKFATDRVIPR